MVSRLPPCRSETVRSPEKVPSAVETSKVCSDQLVVHSIALVVQCQFNRQASPFVAGAMVSTLAYHRRKQDEEEEYNRDQHGRAH